jgi:hypothetical protein
LIEGLTVIRTTVRWLQLVQPPAFIVGYCLLGFCLLEIPFLVSWLRGAPLVELSYVRDRYLMTLAIAWGMHRLAAFHPVYDRSYRTWLESTPWTAKKPLPLGPVQLVLQDVILLAGLMGLMHHTQLDRLAIPFAFLSSYLVLAAWSCWVTGAWWATYSVAFGLGLAFHLREQSASVAAVLLTTYLVVYLGLRKALRDFPWQISQRLELSLTFSPTEGRNRREAFKKRQLGWPCDALSPTPVLDGISDRDGVLVSLAGGWWVYVLCADLQNRMLLSITSLVWLGTSGGCFFSRLIAYCRQHWSPISLWGRLWTLRWIIPGYDKVLLAPLMLIVVNVFTGITIARFGQASIPYALPISETMLLLVALCSRPTLRQWHLTGRHRLMPIYHGDPEFLKH